MMLSTMVIASPNVGPVTYDSSTSIVTIPWDGNFFNVKIQLRGVEVLSVGSNPILNYNFNRTTGVFRIKQVVLDGQASFEDVVLKFTDYNVISEEPFVRGPTPINTLAGQGSLIDGEYQCFSLSFGDVRLSDYKGNYKISLDPLGMYVRTQKLGDVEKFATISSFRRDSNEWIFNYQSSSFLGSSITIDLAQSAYKIMIIEGFSGVACKKIGVNVPALSVPVAPTPTIPNQPSYNFEGS